MRLLAGALLTEALLAAFLGRAGLSAERRTPDDFGFAWERVLRAAGLAMESRIGCVRRP
jgi:hypothetical protein